MSAREIKYEFCDKVVAQQEAKLNAYNILKEKHLPIPSELRFEIESWKRSYGEEYHGK